jgi:hypothetical protein
MTDIAMSASEHDFVPSQNPDWYFCEVFLKIMAKNKLRQSNTRVIYEWIWIE